VDSLSTEQVPLCAPLPRSAHSQIGYKHAEGREIEEQNDIIDSMVRAWLKDFNLPKTLCFKASQAAIDVKNVSSKSVFR